MEDEKGGYVKGNGNIPLLSVSGESIPEAWENSVVELFHDGLWYHRGGRKDKYRLQVDSTMAIEIRSPNSRLLFHKYMTCGVSDIVEYQMEILGAKDSWVDTTGKTTRWPYHYHERLTRYPQSRGIIDQLETGIVQKLKEKPATRQANVITWVPKRDITSDDPPCLQRVWFSLVPDEASEECFVLNMNYNFRSRNVMIAAPMNMLGLRTLQAYIRYRLIEETGKRIFDGRIVDFSDSYHVSAQDQHILAGFMNRLKDSRETGKKFEDRCFTRDEFNDFTKEVYPQIEEKIIQQTGKVLSGSKLEQETKKIRTISRLVRKLNTEAS